MKSSTVAIDKNYVANHPRHQADVTGMNSQSIKA
jgi:hypothetical protein